MKKGRMKQSIWLYNIWQAETTADVIADSGEGSISLQEISDKAANYAECIDTPGTVDSIADEFKN